MLSLIRIIVGFIQYIVGHISEILGYIPILLDTAAQSYSFVTAFLEYIPLPLLGIVKLSLMITFAYITIKILKLVL